MQQSIGIDAQTTNSELAGAYRPTERIQSYVDLNLFTCLVFNSVHCVPIINIVKTNVHEH